MAMVVRSEEKFQLANRFGTLGSAFSPIPRKSEVKTPPAQLPPFCDSQTTAAPIQLARAIKCPYLPRKDLDKVFAECVCPNAVDGKECKNGNECAYSSYDNLRMSTQLPPYFKTLKCKYGNRCLKISICGYKHPNETYHKHTLDYGKFKNPNSALNASKVLVEMRYKQETIRWLEKLPKGCKFSENTPESYTKRSHAKIIAEIDQQLKKESKKGLK